MATTIVFAIIVFAAGIGLGSAIIAIEVEKRGVMKADCGAVFDHEPHLFISEDNKLNACDGSINK